MTRLGPMRNLARTLSAALAIAVIASSGGVAAQERDERRTLEEPGLALVGVWESVAPGGVDCQTREPYGPIIRSVYTIHRGGTMAEENTDPIEGPYRTSGFGVWKLASGRNYSAAYGHYGFDPVSRELNAVIKARTSIRLSRDSRSFTENGTFEVFDRDGNPLIDPVSGDPIRGCFAATAQRLAF